MPPQLLGSVYALLTALSWAVGVILFKRCGRDLGPLTLNLHKNIIAVVLFSATLLAAGQIPAHAPWTDTAIIAASGVLGVAVADTLFLFGLNIVGAGRQAIVDTVYSPTVVVLGAIFLGERLSPLDLAGGALILCGVGVISFPRPQARGRTVPLPPRFGLGLAVSVFAVVLMGVSIVIVKRRIEGYPIVWVTFLRMSGATLVLIAVSALRPLRHHLKAAIKPGPVWRFSLPAAFVGTYLALLFWIGGFKYGDAGTTAILNQMSSPLMAGMAVVFLGERLTAPIVIALVFATAGGVLVFL